MSYRLVSPKNIYFNKAIEKRNLVIIHRKIEINIKLFWSSRYFFNTLILNLL